MCRRLFRIHCMEMVMSKFPEVLSHASGRQMRLDPSRILLAFSPNGRPKGLAKALQSAELVAEDAPTKGKRHPVNQGARCYFVRSKNGKPVAASARDKLLSTLGGSGQGSRLIWVGPVYRFQGTSTDRGLLSPALDVGVLRLGRRVVPGQKLSALLKKAGLAIDAKRSKRLVDALYLVASDVKKRTMLESLAVVREALKLTVRDAHPDYVPLSSPAQATPTSETYWGQQATNMASIGAESAWNDTIGDPSVFVCVIDRGIQRGHEELNRATSRGYDVDTLIENQGAVPGASDVTYPADTTTADSAHGTAISSIAVGEWDVGGVAGLAGGSSLFAISVPNWSALELTLAISRARDLAQPPSGGASKRVILMGGVSNAFKGTVAETELTAALGAEILVACPSGNMDAGVIEYPGDGTHATIMVIGSTDTTDNRYLSNFGPTLTVVAPGEAVPVADLTGDVGYSTTPAPDLDYYTAFEGSSSGAAHVAGLAALLSSSPTLDFAQYPGTSLREKITDVIARTAEKVGLASYNTDINPRNDEMGYGRINAERAITFADVMIRDDPADAGVEPSTGVFWRDSDIVARKDPETEAVINANFDTWQPVYAEARVIHVKSDLSASYCYIRVRNLGPGMATNVRVRAVAAACSTGFMYPTDWDAAEDATHLVMSPDPWPGDPAAVGDEYVVGNLAAGLDKIVRFQISNAQGVKARDTWSGHACALARVTSDNDWAFSNFAPASPVSGEQKRRNNLVQRNLHAQTATSPWFFPFFAGNVADLDEEMWLEVDASRLPAGTLIRLGLDEPERSHPKIDVAELAAAAEVAGLAVRPQVTAARGPSLTLLDRARIKVSAGTARALLTIEAGSKLEYLGTRGANDVEVVGGNVVVRRGRRVVETRGKQTRVHMRKAPGQVFPLYLEIPVPPGARREDRFEVAVAQRNQAGEVVGGFTVVLLP